MFLTSEACVLLCMSLLVSYLSSCKTEITFIHILWIDCFTLRCTCGNCSCGLLANISECYCCKELEGCCEVLTSDLVKEDLQDAQELNCITEHPGFRPVCLEKWSIRLAGGKYRTRNKQWYKKTGSEERSDNPLLISSFVFIAQILHGYSFYLYRTVKYPEIESIIFVTSYLSLVDLCLDYYMFLT